MRIPLSPVCMLAVLLTGPAWAGAAATAAGTSIEMPFLLAPIVVNGALARNAYITSKIIAANSDAAVAIRDQLPFIQDAYIRDVNSSPIGKADDPGTVDSAALAARMLADVRRIVGASLVANVQIVHIQIAELRVDPK